MIGDRRCIVLLFWTLCNNGVQSFITKRPNDIEVRIGDATYLNCSFSNTSASKSWYHYPVGKGAHDLRYVYSREELYPPYNERFRLDTASSDGAFNLVMNQVESQDAGQYVCQNAGDPATAQLIVLESTPHCVSNINSSGIIGPNSCGLQKETIQLSCSVNYSGNISPRLQWTKVKSGKSFPIHDSLLSCLSSHGRITCNYTVEANIEFDGSHFICQTNRSANTPQYNCSTGSVKILYSIENRTKIAQSVGDLMSCSTANTSSADCSYTWIWYDGDLEETLSNNATLKIDREGLHRCEARCVIKDFNCKVITTLLKASAAYGVSTTNTTIWIIGLIECTFGILLLVGPIVWLYRKFCRKATKKTFSEPNVRINLLHETEDQCRKNAAEIETLKAKLKAKTTEVEDLTAEITSKDVEIEDLRNQDAAEIEALNIKLKEKTTEVKDLTADITSKDIKIQDLRNQNAAEIETLKAKLKAKTTEVEDLTADIKSKTMKFEELRTQDAAELETLKAKLKAKTTEVEDLTADIKSKTMKFEELRNQGAAKSKTLKDELNAKATEVEDVTDDITSIDMENEDLYNQGAAKSKTLKDELNAKATEVEDVTDDITSIDMENEDLYNQDAAEIETLKDERKEKTTEVEDLTADIKSKIMKFEGLCNQGDPKKSRDDPEKAPLLKRRRHTAMTNLR